MGPPAALTAGAGAPIYYGSDGGVQISDQARIFERRVLRARRERAAAGLHTVDFLIARTAELLAERLGDVKRRFPLALDLGCHTGQLGRLLEASGRIDTLIQTDLAPAMVRHAQGLRVVADEEALPFGADRFDLIVSGFSLHWVNDLPGALVQIRHALKPDGLFLAAMPGGETLFELRDALMRAELQMSGGAGARVAPFCDVRDAGTLLQRAGFALPVTDLETITVSYAHPLRLLQELRLMGQASALAEPARPLGRQVLGRAAEIYLERYGDARGRVPATFQILTLTGWKPDPSQPQPLRRGSGQVSLARALGVPPEVLEGKAKPRSE